MTKTYRITIVSILLSHLILLSVLVYYNKKIINDSYQETIESDYNSYNDHSFGIRRYAYYSITTDLGSTIVYGLDTVTGRLSRANWKNSYPSETVVCNVLPAPNVDTVETGRFEIATNYNSLRNLMLYDSMTGRLWTLYSHYASNEEDRCVASEIKTNSSISMSPRFPYDEQQEILSNDNRREDAPLVLAQREQYVDAKNLIYEISSDDKYLNIEYINIYSWILATHPHAQMRDGEFALRIIERVVLDSKDPDILDTYAAVLAEIGDYEKAILVQEKAINYISNKIIEKEKNNIIPINLKGDLHYFESSLEKYKQGYPFRQ